MEGRCQTKVRGSVIFLLYCLFARLCFADDPCAGTPPQVAKLNRAVALAAPSAEDFCRGEFRADLIKDPTGREEAKTISFWIDGRETFREVVRTSYDPQQGEIKDVSVVHLHGCTGLLMNALAGATGALVCSDLIVPYKKAFKALKPEGQFSGYLGRDLDGDNEDEILMEKLVLGYGDCVPGALRQYWMSVYHYDSLQGRLVNVSDQFPEFYAVRVKDYQEALQEIERTVKLSSQCRARMQNLIGKARRLAALSAPVRPAVETPPTSVRPVTKEESLNLLARRGDINDFAGMLSEAEQRELESMIESVKKDAATELVIVTIPSYQPSKSLRQYAQALLQAWEIGKERRRREMMIILAQKEKEALIATQLEIRTILTEEACNVILRDTVLPSLRKGAYGRGFADGIIQIRGVLRGDKKGGKPTAYQGGNTSSDAASDEAAKEVVVKKKGAEDERRLALVRERSKKPLELIAIRFFNTAKDGKHLSPSMESFAASQLRFVAWEAVFRNQLHDLAPAYHRMEAIYYAPSSRLLGTVRDGKDVAAESAEVIFTGRIGNARGGAFIPGTYRVDFSLNGSPLTSRQFRVEDDHNLSGTFGHHDTHREENSSQIFLPNPLHIPSEVSFLP